MKIVEPISSALLITGCVYAAGISQNSAFMRGFGINPEFSQPSIDKILYDGGLITFEVFYEHLKWISLFVLVILLVMAFVWGVMRFISPGSVTTVVASVLSRVDQIKGASSYAPVGVLLLLYIMYLCFSSYQKSQEVGVKLSEVFMENCHWVILKDKKNTTKACAFRKDKDSIWYYTIKEGDLNINSKLLAGLDQVTYLEPQKNSTSSEPAKDKKESL
ncbi:hypothetical protein [Pseudomonas sp. NFIX28]|uniref:hypothetical protein n=1 Tax=Pseudomonas sp. NFIX28 TaxID=1566235 RepID=UPI0008984F7C|nr:hypothetical protein [Pseudomonas sp. NFIX28]SDZ55186.1 hypothetical protein SAMN03159453_04538 [Pseudomonas sp. NFIX28]